MHFNAQLLAKHSAWIAHTAMLINRPGQGDGVKDNPVLHIKLPQRSVQKIAQIAFGNFTLGQVNLGGQWLLHGPGQFEIQVADPDARHAAVASLRVSAGSVATSGNSERGILVDGQRYGHVLDPRSGEPAADFGSVTVVHPDPFAADCLATAFLVLGPEAALAWAKRDPLVEVLIVTRGQAGPQVVGSAGLDFTPAQQTSPSP